MATRPSEVAHMPDFGPCRVLSRSDRHVICRSTDPTDGAAVVVKMTAPDAGPEVVAALRHEHEVLSGHALPGVARARELRQIGDDLALVLDDAGPQSLRELLTGGPLPIRRFLALAAGIAAIVAEVHEAHLIHRDLNPSNIAMDAAGEAATLIDFGLATSVSTVAPVDRSPWELEGSLPYLSPEQTGRTGRSVDHRTDLYALGATFYEMLTGHPPFTETDPVALVHAHLARRPRPPADLRPGLPGTVSALVLRLLAKEPEARYQTARGVEHDLRLALERLTPAGDVPPFELARGDRPRALQIPETLVGREAARTALKKALAGPAPPGRALVTVTGEAGIGKTALVRQGLAAAAQAGAAIAVGRFDPSRQHVPYAGVAEAIGHLAHQMMTAPEPLFSAWRQRVQGAIAPSGRLVTDLVPELGEVLGPQPPLPALDPAETRDRLNLTFARLAAALGPPDAPVVWFLDDLQWADAASLALIAHLATAVDPASLRLVCAYRDREVGPGHPLALTLEALERAGGRIRAIHLGPLRVVDVTRLCAAALGVPAAEARPLARELHRRSGGNPFFLRRLLASLEGQATLRYDDAAARWRWSADALAGAALSVDVSQSLRDEIERLPPESRTLLPVAAGVGHQVDLGVLAAVTGRTRAATASALWPAVTHGLLQPVQGAERALLHAGPLDERVERLRVTFQFADDRVHEAAYARLDEAERPRLHLRIGRLMLADHGAAPEHIFETVDQLNAGASLLADDGERLTVATLNLAAGRRARAAGALDSALALASSGLAVLPASTWTAAPDLAHALHRLAAEGAYLAGDQTMGDRLVTEALVHASSAEAIADLYGLRIGAATAAGDYAAALALGHEGLARVGVLLPTGDPEAALAEELAAIDEALAGRAIADLKAAPEATDPRVIAAMHLLAELYVPAYVTDQRLMAIQIARMVRLSLRHGRTPYAAEAYAQYGLLLLGTGTLTGTEEAAFAFGRLATDLAHQGGHPARLCKVSTVFAGTLNHWRAPLKSGVALARAAFAAGQEGGELQFASYAASALVYTLFDSGSPLPAVSREIELGAAFAEKAGNKLVIDILDAYRQAVRLLRDPAAGGLDDAQFRARAADAPTALFLYETLRLRLAYMAGDHEEAARLAASATRRLAGAKGLFATADLVFLEALNLAARVPEAGTPDHAAWAAALDERTARLTGWAALAPANFRHKLALVAAERLRVEGRPWEALRAYDAAIEGAQLEGFQQDEALACELAGRFFFAEGHPRIARTYLRAASTAYHRWGATARAAALERAFPGWLAPSGGPGRWEGDPHATTVTSSGTRRLDALSLLKAAQALSGETVVERMLETMTAIAMEAAGATRGVLLLEEHGALVVRARGAAGATSEIRLVHEPLSKASDLPRAILHYAWRTREPVALDNAARDPLYANDPVVGRGLRSVLCVPIADQGRLRGLLYVENEQLVGAFGPERSEVLRLLAAQMAISLENALLLADLRQAAIVIGNSPIMLFRWKYLADVAVDYVSDNVERLLGYTRAEMLTGRVSLISIIHPEDQPRVLAAYAAAVDAGEDRAEFSYRVLTRSGEQRWIEALSTFERDEAGKLRSIQGILADVTARKRAEEERTASLIREQAARAEIEAAREVDRLKTAFVNAVSHDLRTPLTTITGYAEFLEDELAGPLNEAQRKYLDQIQKSTRRLEGLVNDLLDVARLEAGTFTLNPSEVDLGAMLAEIVESFRPQVQAMGVRLEVDVPAEPLLLQADVPRLERVFTNLIGNALKFTPAGGAIGLRVRLDGAVARSEVTDTGPGIAPDDLPRLFQRFVQLEAGTRKGGTGLGLSISKAIVEAHGGRIGADSQPGAGSTFWFTLPLTPPG